MKRLLVIGNKIPRLPSIEWGQATTHNILDYQGLLFDCRSLGQQPTPPTLASILSHYIPHGHPIFVILPNAQSIATTSTDLTFLPLGRITVTKVKGDTANLVNEGPPFIEYCRFLQGHEVVFTPHGSSGTRVPTTIDNIGRLICGIVGNIFIFHPPARGRDQKAFKAIIDHFKPDFEEPEPEAPPEWAQDVIAAMPGIAQIEACIAEFAKQIHELQGRQETELKKKESLENWAQMLWLDGIPLQNRVREAFDFLGFKTESEHPTGHTRDLVAKHSSHCFLIEVTGSTGSIKIDKGRELLQWVIDTSSPADVKGVLVGNAFRTASPGNRPPTSNHKVFSVELEKQAQKYHLGLVDARDLFNLVLMKLERKQINLDSICDDMSVDGIVKIHVT